MTATRQLANLGQLKTGHASAQIKRMSRARQWRLMTAYFKALSPTRRHALVLFTDALVAVDRAFTRQPVKRGAR